ncbi:MAG: ATP-grasp domain-containing protein [Bacteroidetes bacterium]|nr:ATP-grasp domain-containing protein [Bacteroidota bacterium]
MYYVVQSNIYSDPEHERVFSVLEELGYTYERYELKPETASIIPQTDRHDIFVYGSVKLCRLAKANISWYPGSFYGGNHQYEVYAPYYGEHLLNAKAEVFAFGKEITWKEGEEKFIKPYADAKVFTGKVFAEAEWKDFVYESLAQPRTPLLHAETKVQASPVQHLISEARVWIIGNQIIQSVYYRFHGDQPFQKQVSPDGLEFVQQMITRFTIADAYVMDIGHTPDGWKIVEINCINSAGLYSSDPRPIFRALDLYFS